MNQSALALARIRRNLTQPELAEQVGLKTNSISRIEREGAGDARTAGAIVLHLGRAVSLEEVCFPNGMDSALAQPKRRKRATVQEVAA